MSEQLGPAPSTRTGQDEQLEIVTSHQRLILPEDIKIGKRIGLGGYADVHEGSLTIAETKVTKKVAVKRFRVLLEKDKKFEASFGRELLIWARLHHTNVLPLFGMVIVDDMPALVSEWMSNGTMSEYLKMHEDVDVLELVKNIACGLEYLHDVGVVHSDLKGDNVLISHEGRPVISDFGISRLLINSKTFAGTTSIKGSTRWMAPEFFTLVEGVGSEHSCHTKATDVWAFGMVVYEVLSGKIPFYSIQTEGQVIALILSTMLPNKPCDRRACGRHFDVLWDCCAECWRQDPRSRPAMQELRERLNGQPKGAYCEHLNAKCDSVFCVEQTFRVSARWCWLSPIGRFLAIITNDWKILSFMDTRTMSRCGPDLRLDDEVWDIAWSTSEEDVVVLTKNWVLRKWSNIFQSPTMVAHSTQEHERAWLKFSTDDRFVASIYGSITKLWNASNLTLIWEHETGLWSSSAFHPLGNRVFFFWRSVLDVNIEDQGSITTTQHDLDFEVYDLVFDQSRNECIVSTEQGVKILSGDTFKEKTSFPYRGCVGVQITPDEKYILLVLESKKVLLWNIAAGKVVEELALDLALNTLSWAKISKNCRVLVIDDAYTIHLRPAYR